jgi:hypothetical protein
MPPKVETTLSILLFTAVEFTIIGILLLLVFRGCVSPRPRTPGAHTGSELKA